jgi:hypothetical protein
MKFLNAGMNIEKCMSYSKIGLKFGSNYAYMKLLMLVQCIFNVIDIRFNSHTLFYGYMLYFFFGKCLSFGKDKMLENVTFTFYKNGVLYYRHLKNIMVHDLYDMIMKTDHKFEPVSESMRKCIKVTYMGKNYTKKFTRMNHSENATISDVLSCFTKVNPQGKVKIRKISTGAFKGWDNLLGMKNMDVNEPISQI